MRNVKTEPKPTGYCYACAECSSCGATLNLDMRVCNSDYNDLWPHVEDAITCCDTPHLKPLEVFLEAFPVLVDDTTEERKMSRVDIVIRLRSPRRGVME